ncbi:hypothetical protein [Neobacillus niacini]|uniref:hypothetical protein n=1 Tax=Neobacillus niacini TaxID=86668 RepID=UPI00203C2E3E|nr:hypothetical protein [Neobacillus niacini]MCM3691086.1 hypothetical protein [Neobacillus niacini]
MKKIEPDKLSMVENYKMLIGSILPRPIALVSTFGSAGSNVAPFSFFTSVSIIPPIWQNERR